MSRSSGRLLCKKAANVDVTVRESMEADETSSTASSVKHAADNRRSVPNVSTSGRSALTAERRILRSEAPATSADI